MEKDGGLVLKLQTLGKCLFYAIFVSRTAWKKEGRGTNDRRE